MATTKANGNTIATTSTEGKLTYNVNYNSNEEKNLN